MYTGEESQKCENFMDDPYSFSCMPTRRSYYYYIKEICSDCVMWKMMQEATVTRPLMK